MLSHNKIFNGRICEFETTIILNGEGIKFMLISENSGKAYEAILPENESKCKELQQIFTNLDEFFDYICDSSEDHQRVRINSQATIQVHWNPYNRKSKHPANKVIIPTVRLIRSDGKDQQRQKKLKKLSSQNKHLKSNLSSLEIQNESYKAELQTLKKTIEGIQEDGTVTPTAHNSTSTSLEEYESFIGKQNKVIRYLEQMLTAKDKELAAMKSTIQQLNNSTISSDQHPSHNHLPIDTQLETPYGRKMNLSVDLNNKYLKYFVIDKNRIEKVGSYDSCQILAKHYFSIHLKNISYAIFSVGIVNQNRRNYKNSHESKECITYYAKDGSIYECGGKRAGGPKITQKIRQIIVSVDRDKAMIKWFADGKEVASTLINPVLNQERIVPYFQLNYDKNIILLNSDQI